MVLTKPADLSYPKAEVVTAVGDSLSLVPTVTGDLITYTLQGNLPQGLQFNQDTGEITGIATTYTERSDLTVMTSNEVGSVSYSLVLRILTKISGFAYPKGMYSFVKGNSYSLIPSVTGDEITFSINGALPEGLILNSSTGVIEGIISSFYVQSYVTVHAENDVSSASTIIQITVLPLSPLDLILTSVIIILLIVLFSKLYHSSHKKRQLLVHNIEELKSQLPEPVKAETPVVVVASSDQPTNQHSAPTVPQRMVVDNTSPSQSVHNVPADHLTTATSSVDMDSTQSTLQDARPTPLPHGDELPN